MEEGRGRGGLQHARARHGDWDDGVGESMKIHLHYTTTLTLQHSEQHAPAFLLCRHWEGGGWLSMGVCREREGVVAREREVGLAYSC